MAERSCFAALICITCIFVSLSFIYLHHGMPIDLRHNHQRLVSCSLDRFIITRTVSNRNVFPCSSRTTSSNNCTLKDTNEYLTLVNKVFDDASLCSGFENSPRSQVEERIRSGYGLEPYTTESGETGWVENGMVYRPWRKPDPSTIHKKYPSPYTTEYEVYIPFDEQTFFEGRQPDGRYKTEKKIILWHKKTRYTEEKNGLNRMRHCPEFPCYITTNRKFSQNSSAMIFTAQIMAKSPPARKPDQMFILHNHERPYIKDHPDRLWRKGFLQPAWRQVFNWTMTYRRDSDFFVPYGVVRKRPTPLLHKDYRTIVKKKTKIAAWLVSNCKTSSQRRKYVRELQKYISVDIYGTCGTKRCPRKKDDECSKIISDSYKFYISFENSICSDYITEKFFRYLTMDTVLVVRGGNQYSTHAPRELFLNTADFPSPKDLAKRMLYLHNNDNAYIDILREKDKYISIFEDYPIRDSIGSIKFMAYRFESPALCHICQRLWNLDKYAKSVLDIHEWFNKKTCSRPGDLHF